MTTWKYNDYLQWINDGCKVNDKVIELYLSECNLTKISENIGNLINLHTLHCYKNKLTKLPETLGNLINLQDFSCSCNELTELPKNLCNLINLQNLYCSDNRITELPETLGNLINLRVLYCYDNKLKKLPKSIGNMINLIALHCDVNQLIELPISIIKLKHLKNIIYDDIRIPIILQRFMNRICNNIINVHNNSIQASLVDSINILLLENIIKDINLLDDNILDIKSKSMLYTFIEDKTQSYLLINFEELLVYILEKIDN